MNSSGVNQLLDRTPGLQAAQTRDRIKPRKQNALLRVKACRMFAGR